jgi:hypothetical protein
LDYARLKKDDRINICILVEVDIGRSLRMRLSYFDRRKEEVEVWIDLDLETVVDREDRKWIERA